MSNLYIYLGNYRLNRLRLWAVIVVLWLILLPVYAQRSRADTKLDNAYRGAYQRINAAAQSNCTYEVRNGTL